MLWARTHVDAGTAALGQGARAGSSLAARSELTRIPAAAAVGGVAFGVHAGSPAIQGAHPANAKTTLADLSASARVPAASAMSEARRELDA